jgi:sterol desaturase/sphingolipid hydroxylase (fatty acid hydroxylase superfamily)
MWAFLSFWMLFGFSLLQPQQRQLLRQKPLQDWLLDGVGLGVQGAIIPILQTLLILKGYAWVLPHARGCLDLEPWLGFVTSFVGLDYLYYWNHRGLHTAIFFPIHAVHHTVTQMDMVGSSRNTLWSSLLIPYVWVNGLMVYLLQDPSGYLLGITLTYLLDLWRHSSFAIAPNSLLYHLLNPWLTLPQDHAHHHGSSILGNFGANLKLWDRLHKTDLALTSDPILGIPLDLSLTQKLFWPFSKSVPGSVQINS